MKSRSFRSAIALAALASLSGVLLSLPTRAQLSVRWSGGVLGSGLEIELEGPANKTFVFIPSTQPGPTPIPNDGRLLQVGFELPKSFWRLGPLNGPGNPSYIGYVLPNDPSLAGLPFYGQAVSIRGVGTLVDQISNPVSFVISLPGQTHTTFDTTFEPRSEHTATVLENGRVLMLGGMTSVGGFEIPSQTWEIFDPQRQSYSGPTGLLPQRRYRHTASLLDNGTVLIVGGAGANGNALASTVLFTPGNSSAPPTVTSGPPLQAGRVHHTATVLKDGRVLVVGGATQTKAGNTFGFPTSFMNGASPVLRIYDPVSNQWSNGASLPQPLVGHRAALLPDGRVLIAGGVELANPPKTVKACWIYDPVANTLRATVDLPKALAFSLMIPTVGDEVLLASGTNIDPQVPASIGSAASYVFQIGSGAPAMSASWTAGPPTNGIIQNGEIQCIPPRCFPGTLLGLLPPLKAPVEYFAGGGYESVDLAAGTQTASSDILRLDENLTGWTDLGPTALQHVGGRMTVIGDGFRLLMSGSDPGAGSPGSLNEIRVLGN